MTGVNGSQGMRRWLVFYTRSRSEKLCERYINNMNIRAFLPKCEEIRQWKDRKKKIVLPLFPNYIFAHVNEIERIRVLECRGVVRNLNFGTGMIEIKPEEIRQIELMQTKPGHLETYKEPLPALGKTISVEEGPMKGLKGDIVEHYGETHLLVRINSINQAVKVKLPAYMVTELT